MPPPPPPSKSYLIQIDTDSSDDEKEERELEQWMSSTGLDMQEQKNGSGNIIEIGTVEERCAPEPEISKSDVQSPSKAKKKRRRKRHKKKKQATAAPEKKHVSFGSVSLRLVERKLGGDGVPADGGWPLGFSDAVIQNVDSISIDDYEDHRRIELEKRWREKVKSDPPLVLETRQWDYKKPRDDQGYTIRNPLFSSLSEDERHALLINKAVASVQPTKSKSSGSGHGHKHQIRRTRSSSIDFAAGPYDPVHIRHVRNELEDLRGCRTSDGSTGCTCRKLHVHLPPKNGGGGKKSQHKRLSMAKVKEELRKRHYKLPSHNVPRDELEKTLFDMVQDEACCTNNDCPCVRNGLGCQADTCSCWSHAQSDSEQLSTVESFQALCGNKHGIYVVDTGAIASYRKDMIAKTKHTLFCHVVSASDETVIKDIK